MGLLDFLLFDDATYYAHRVVKERERANEIFAIQDQTVDQLWDRVQAQAGQMERLRKAVTVLHNLLVERGMAASEIESQVAAVLKEPDAEPSASPAGGDPADWTTCDGCRKSVLIASTNVTEQGTLCDRCFAAMSAK
jgi:uncharacterized coiled-coil protein SlyX